MKDHRLVITVEHDVTRYEFICDAPDMAECKAYCPNWCEVAGITDGRCDNCKSEAAFSASCNIMPWFDDPGAEEMYAGDPHVLYDGPFEMVWNGGNYDWTFPKEESNAHVPGDGNDDQPGAGGD